MKVYLKSVDAFYAWMDKRGVRYAVVYGGANMGEAPKRGGKWLLGVVVDRVALRPHIAELMGLQTSRLWGYGCNIYASEDIGSSESFSCFHQLPSALVEAALEGRQRWQGSGHYVPGEQEAYDLLLYYITYIEAESGGVKAFDSSSFKRHRWHGFLSAVAQRLGLVADMALMDMHVYLRDKGYAISRRLACSCVQRQFIAGLKSEFYAHLFRELDGRGEMNYIVLRERVVKEGKLHRKDNALHSTDNEAEAIGHFNLFFTPAEEQEIYEAVARRRERLAQV